MMRRRYLLLLVVLVLLAAAHRWILLGIGGFLASGRAVEEPFDYVLLGGGDGELEMAASLLEARQHRKVVLCESEPTRLVQFGVLPPSHEVDIQRLVKLGVARERIVLIPQDERQIRWATDLFCQWHRQHEMPRTVVLCEEMAQRNVWIQLRQYCDSSQLDQLYSLGLVNRNYPVDRWWHSRSGIKSVVQGYVALAIARLTGPEQPLPKQQWWDPDDYESRLIELKQREAVQP